MPDKVKFIQQLTCNHPVIYKGKLIFLINSYYSKNYHVTPSELDMLAKKAGWRSLGRINLGKRGNRTYYSTQDHDKINKMTNREIVELYDANA